MMKIKLKKMFNRNRCKIFDFISMQKVSRCNAMMLLFILAFVPTHLFGSGNAFGFTSFSGGDTSVLQQNISGVVSDDQGMVLPGVSVIIKGTSTGVATDFDGAYTIQASNGDVLIFSYVGFNDKEVTVGPNTNYNITLEVDTAQLDEVVVVGYGTQRKADVTGSIATIKVEDVVKMPSTNIKNSLIGQVPGLITNQNPGLPGAGNVDLSIRGFGAPLVIVDGIETFMDRIDPNDIESVTILKDAAAAIYGTRGGNGVVLVTTKRGKSGKTQVKYHGYTGRQFEIALPEFADAADFIEVERNAVFNEQYDPTNPSAVINYPERASLENLMAYRNGEKQSYDWKKGLIKAGGAEVANHNFNVSGGTEKLRHYTSVGVMAQNGILKGDYKYNKITVTHNLDAKIANNLDLALNANYIDEVQDYAAGSVSNILNDLRTSQPFYNYELPDPNKVPFSGFSQRSIIGRMFKKFAGYNLQKRQTLTSALELKYKTPIEGLTLGSKINVRLRNRYTEVLNKPYDVFTYEPEIEGNDQDRYIYRGSLLSNSVSTGFNGGGPRTRILTRFYADFKKAYGKHKVSLLAFAETEDNKTNDLSVTKQGNLAPEVPIIRGTGDYTVAGQVRDLEYSRASFAGRLVYNFDDRYIIQGTLRADGSSKFGPKNRWGYFPAASVAWNIHNESFLEDSNTINTLKFKLSYGQSGLDNNVSNTAFEYLTGFTENTNLYSFDGAYTPGIVNAGLVNELISWQEVTMYNAGIEFSLFDSKLFGEAEVFYRTREGLFGADPTSVSSIFGANLPLINLNSRNNRGAELSLGYRGRVNKDFSFRVKGNIGYTREKYDYQAQDIDLEDPFQVKYNLRSGNWVNRTFGYITDGLFNSQEEVDEFVANHTWDINGSPKPGDIRYVDVNGDGVIAPDDRELIGRGGAPNLTFGFQTNFTYKNFNFIMNWQGASLFNMNLSGHMRNPFNNEQVVLTFHKKYAWTQDPANPGVSSNPNAILPAFETSGANARPWNNVSSDFWNKKVTFARLKTATISYSLPKDIARRLQLSNFELYFSGDNLLTIDNLGVYSEGYDPEQTANSNGFALPLMRTFSLGTRITL